MKHTNKWEDPKINVKIKLSALWASLMFCYVYGDYFELYVPGKVQGLSSGNNLLDSPLKLFAASLLLTVPALMIFLSIMLRPVINRLLNLVFGLFYTALMLLIACSSISKWLGFYVFLALVESIITIIVVWQAWTWPKTGGEQ